MVFCSSSTSCSRPTLKMDETVFFCAIPDGPPADVDARLRALLGAAGGWLAGAAAASSKSPFKNGTEDCPMSCSSCSFRLSLFFSMKDWMQYVTSPAKCFTTKLSPANLGLA